MGYFPSSSALSGYQHPGSFSRGPLPTSPSQQDSATFSPTHSSLLSPPASLPQNKPSSLAFGRLLYSQSNIFRSSEEPHVPSKSSDYHLLSPQINILSPQLHNQSTQLYNASTFSSTSALAPAQPQIQSPQQDECSRQDNRIKSYQNTPPTEFTTLPQQHYVHCGKSSGYYQQRASHHQQAGVTDSPCGEKSPFSDFKPSLQIEAQTYHPNVQSTYIASSCSASEENKYSSLSSGYSSSESTSFSSNTLHTPPTASTACSSFSYNAHSSTGSLTARSYQQPLGPSLLSSTQQSAPTTQCLVSSSMAKCSTALSGKSPPVPFSQPYSPKQPPSKLLSYSCEGFRLPHAHEQGFSGAAGGSFSKRIGFGDTSFSSVSFNTPDTPEYGSIRFSSVNRPASGLAAHSGALISAGNVDVSPTNGVSTYIPKSNLSPSIKTALYCSDMPSPAQAYSPGGPQVTKCFLRAKHLKNPNEGEFYIQPLLQAQNSPSHPLQYIGHSTSDDKGLSCTENETPGEEGYSFKCNLEIPQNEHQKIKPDMTMPKSTAKNCPLGAVHSRQATPEPLHTPVAFGKSIHWTQYSHDVFLCNTQKTQDMQQAHHGQQQQQQPVSQQIIGGSMMGAVHSRMQMKPHSQSSQLHLQPQKNDTDYSLESQPGDQTQYRHNSVPSHDLLNQSLQQYNSTDSGAALDRSGTVMTAGGRVQDGGDRHQTELKPQTLSEHNNFTSKPDLHHPSQPHTIEPNQQQQQVHAASLPYSQLSQPHWKGAAGTRHEKLQQHFTSLSSACFTERFLHDEEHSFFPMMEEMFCSSNYKTGCAGDSGTYLADQEGFSQSHKQGQGNMVQKKAVGDEGGLDLVSHYSDGTYQHYYPNLQQSDSSICSDFMSLKASALPSTVSTDQLGLIQSQTPTIPLSSNTTDLTSPIFSSSQPKKLLKPSSFLLLKHRPESQIQPRKNYAQEYEFENEDKADVPAEIRLNSRRFHDVLPDLVSSCQRVGGVLGGTNQMVDINFCFPSSCNSLTSPQAHTVDGPKKRGRKPTKPKREGPPRPRGRPRIRPLPQPSFYQGLTGSGAGVSRRGRGRGRGRRKDRLVHQGINKVESIPYHCPQEYPQQQFSQLQHSYELGPNHPPPPPHTPQQHAISAHTSQQQRLLQHRHTQQGQPYQPLQPETERPMKVNCNTIYRHLYKYTKQGTISKVTDFDLV